MRHSVSEASAGRIDGLAEWRETLQAQRDAWSRRPLLRALYTGWFRLIERELSPLDGPTVELGSGIGSFKEFRPATIATDVADTPWSDEVVDAEALPYDDGCVANLVMLDVLHHLRHPSRFLAEAERVLRPGGRVVVCEPYCSPVSTVAYKALHHEPIDLDTDPLGDQAQSSERPFDSNQALPTLLFWRHADRLAARHPALVLTRRRRLALLLYPLSGGFSRPTLVPRVLWRPLAAVERLLSPLAPLLAFRCLVTLERRLER